MDAEERKKLLRSRPYYAVLYAINKIKGRLPAEVEKGLSRDPEACLIYAEKVLCGRLPDHLHNAMLLGSWEGGDREVVREYLSSFPEGSRA